MYLIDVYENEKKIYYYSFIYNYSIYLLGMIILGIIYIIF